MVFALCVFVVAARLFAAFPFCAEPYARCWSGESACCAVLACGAKTPHVLGDGTGILVSLDFPDPGRAVNPLKILTLQNEMRGVSQIGTDLGVPANDANP